MKIISEEETCTRREKLLTRMNESRNSFNLLSNGVLIVASSKVIISRIESGLLGRMHIFENIVEKVESP